MFREIYVSPGSKTGLVRDISGTWVMAVERQPEAVPVETLSVFEQGVGQVALVETAQPERILEPAV